MAKNKFYQQSVDTLNEKELEKYAEVIEDRLIEKIAIALAPMMEQAALAAVNTTLIKLGEAQEAQELANETEAQAPATAADYENTDVVSDVVDPTRDVDTIEDVIEEAFIAGETEPVHRLIESAPDPELAAGYAEIALGLIDRYILSGAIDQATGDEIKEQLKATLDASISNGGK